MKRRGKRIAWTDPHVGSGSEARLADSCRRGFTIWRKTLAGERGEVAIE
jgi:hypothetical protein